jgi:hypothetical protein
VTVSGVGNLRTSAKGRGTIKLESVIDGHKSIIILEDVLYIPSNRHNLFSLGRWDAAGSYYHGQNGQLTPMSKGKPVARGRKIGNNLYQLMVTLQHNLQAHLRMAAQSYAVIELAQS